MKISGIRDYQPIGSDALETFNRSTKYPTSAEHKGEKNNNAKLISEKILEVREKHASGKYLQKDLADEYGVSQAHISDIVNRKTWRHVT